MYVHESNAISKRQSRDRPDCSLRRGRELQAQPLDTRLNICQLFLGYFVFEVKAICLDEASLRLYDGFPQFLPPSRLLPDS